MKLEENYVEIKNRILQIPDLDERNLAIARWALSFLPEYCFKAPPPAPAEVIEYQGYDAELRKKMNKEPWLFAKFWHHPDVKEYFDAAERIRHLNHRNRQFLLWIKSILKEPEIEQALATYPMSLEEIVWND